MDGIKKMQKIAILINSCDKYSDVWEIFFPLFFKYWPDCPWEIYLGSNTKLYNHPKVKPLIVGEDISWADSTRKMLEQLPYDNVLFFLDDFFIFWHVNNVKVMRLYEWFCNLDANYLRFRNDPPINIPVAGYPELVEIMPGEFYRTSLDIAFWKRSTFLSILKEGESPWSMEINGSERSIRFPGFYASREWVIERRNGLEAGKWKRYNLELIKKEGLIVPYGHSITGIVEHYYINLKGQFYRSVFYKSHLYRILHGTGKKVYRFFFPTEI
jgi:hypothetical protein